MAKKKEQINFTLITHIGAAIGYGLLFFFLIVNILFSQFIPSPYFALLHSDKNTMIEFLKQSRSASYFPILYPEIQTIFASKEEEIYGAERRREALIERLEILKEENPKSRDILYSLHLLYEKAGDEAKSEQYLHQAAAIDPGVK